MFSLKEKVLNVVWDVVRVSIAVLIILFLAAALFGPALILWFILSPVGFWEMMAVIMVGTAMGIVALFFMAALIALISAIIGGRYESKQI